MRIARTEMNDCETDMQAMSSREMQPGPGYEYARYKERRVEETNRGRGVHPTSEMQKVLRHKWSATGVFQAQ